jgi:hypothetical protein
MRLVVQVNIQILKEELKTIAQALQPAFGSAVFDVEADLCNLHPGPEGRIVGRRLVSKDPLESIDIWAPPGPRKDYLADRLAMTVLIHWGVGVDDGRFITREELRERLKLGFVELFLNSN